LEVGGCFAAHNVSERRRWGNAGYLDYARGLPNLETKLIASSRSGISVSYKVR
jgi:hypothetical protein